MWDRGKIADLVMLRDRTGKQNNFVSDFVISITIYLPSSKANAFYFILHITADNVFSRDSYKSVFYLTGAFIHVLFTHNCILTCPEVRLIRATPVPFRIKEWIA